MHKCNYFVGPTAVYLRFPREAIVFRAELILRAWLVLSNEVGRLKLLLPRRCLP